MATALRSHPDVFIPRAKEAYHFGYVDDAAVGGVRYQKFFSEWEGQPVVGEATPEYLFRPESADQICRYLPEVKALVLLRNPVDRAYSGYWHGVRDGWVRGTFRQTIDAELAGDRYRGKAFRDLVQRGRYVEQLERYRQLGFDRDRMLVLIFEEVLADESAALLEVQNFLGLQPLLTQFPRVNQARSNSLPRIIANAFARTRIWRHPLFSKVANKTDRPFTPSPMDPEMRETLVAYYRSWNNELSELLGRDLSFWNQ
jgi:hypothetical protein